MSVSAPRGSDGQVRRPAVAAALAVVAFIAAGPLIANAQDAPAFMPGRVVLSGGAAVNGSYPVGDITVTIPRNAAPDIPPFTLLRAESTIGRAPAVEGRVAVGVTRYFAVEVGGAYATPDLGVTVSQDVEFSGSAFASERIQQYVIDVSGIYQLPLSLGARMRPYVFAGGGYLRQLHEGRLLVDTGRSLHGGGGVQYWLRLPSAGRGIGVRGEARLVRRTGGVDFDQRSRRVTGASALGFIAF